MRSLFALLFSVLLAAAAHAAPPSEESIDNLLAAMKTEKTLETVFSTLDQVMRQSVAAATQGQTFTTEQQRVIDATPARLAAIMQEEMSWIRMRPLYAQIYRESFTQEEVDGLTAFYRSPIGVAYIDKMPVVMQKSMALMQERMGPMVDKINGVIEQAVREAKGIH